MSREGWYVAKTECRVCGNKDVSVFPEGTDADAMECARCHAMSAEAVEYVPPDKEDR